MEGHQYLVHRLREFGFFLFLQWFFDDCFPYLGKFRNFEPALGDFVRQVARLAKSTFPPYTGTGSREAFQDSFWKAYFCIVMPSLCC